MLNSLLQKINSKKPRGTLKPNYSVHKIVAKRVISVGLISINYSFIIPADHSNYTVLLIYFSLLENYPLTPQKRESFNMDLNDFLKLLHYKHPYKMNIRWIHQGDLMVH